MENQKLCVDNLVEQGKYFSKFVTKNEKCQGSIIQSQSVTKNRMMISAVVVVLVFGSWAAYALYLRYRRCSRDWYLLLPYVKLHRGVYEDEISLETNFSVQRSSESGSSTSEYLKSPTQSDTDTDAEPKRKLKIETEPESRPEPVAETKTEPKSEPAPDAETNTNAKTETKPKTKLDAETGTNVKTETEPVAETSNDAGPVTDGELYFLANEKSFSSNSSFSLHDKSTLEDKDSDANTLTY